MLWLSAWVWFVYHFWFSLDWLYLVMSLWLRQTQSYLFNKWLQNSPVIFYIKNLNGHGPLPTYVDVLDLTDVLILSYAGLDDISWLFRVRAPLLVEGHSQWVGLPKNRCWTVGSSNLRAHEKIGSCAALHRLAALLRLGYSWCSIHSCRRKFLWKADALL